MDIDCSKILKSALSRGGDYADLYIENTAPTAIVLEDGKVEKVISGIEAGAGLRVIVGLRTVYAYTNDLTEKALLELAAKVTCLPAILPPRQSQPAQAHGRRQQRQLRRRGAT